MARTSGTSRTKSKGTGKGMPELLFAQASPRSIGGSSLFNAVGPVNQDTFANYLSEDQVVSRAVSLLQQAGFLVLQVTQLTINIAGAPSLFEEVLGTRLVTDERPVIKGGGREDTATFIDCPDTDVSGLLDTIGTPLGDAIEGIAIEEPRYPMAASPFAPTKAYWHLDVPGGVSLALNADRAHRGGTTGLGVKVLMADSGWFRHPYFENRGYRFSPTVLGPGAQNSNDDESGHGTAESANVFAVAPDVDFTMVKMSFTNTTGGFNAAVALAPHVISCSWGSDIRQGPLSAVNQALAAAIGAAVAGGIVVVFSAGNGHHGFPGMHPDVISAGGAFMNPDGTFIASDYASGFSSNVYAGRNCPDVCGLVGMKPRAAYIMLPLQPGDDIDTDLAGGGAHPNGDETAANDGWAAISGTSAAAPQLAGLCALLKQVCPTLTPADVKDILQKSARDVTSGHCNTSASNSQAVAGVDVATGHGLVDAHKAVLLAKVRCMGRPPITVQPPITVRPPVQPPIVLPPVRPPITPPIVRPPIVVGPPIRPPVVGPVILPAPKRPGQQAGGYALTAEEAAALEQAIIEAENPDFGL